jgi:hypothetical protein
MLIYENCLLIKIINFAIYIYSLKVLYALLYWDSIDIQILNDWGLWFYQELTFALSLLFIASLILYPIKNAVNQYDITVPGPGKHDNAPIAI